MTCYAILCGSAPKGLCQKKLEDKYDFLEKGEADKSYELGNIVVFPCGVNELFLEGLLNEAFEKASDTEEDGLSGQVLLYLCARTQADLSAELSDCSLHGVEVVRLGEDEIRKEVIAYYASLAEKVGVDFRVEYDWDGELIAEESLGWERVEA
ncbi:MAG: hypothetical protein IJ630_07675 [Treponema sp.]|nr:hypothetical protein [Treponema sp.]